MKHINEYYDCTCVKLNISAMSADYNNVDFNKLRDTFEDEGADVNGQKEGAVLYMVVNGLTKKEVEEILAEAGIEEIEDGEYMECCTNNEAVCPKCGKKHCTCKNNKCECECECEFPDYDDVNEDDTNDNNELFENNTVDDELYDNCMHVLQDCINRGQLDPADTIDDQLYELVEFIADPIELDDAEYDKVCDTLKAAWEEVSANNIEDSNLLEKRRGCCPTKKLLSEALKASKTQDQQKLNKIEATIKDLISDTGRSTIGVAEARAAFKKLKAENSKLKKIEKENNKYFSLNDIAGTKQLLKTIKNADPEKINDIKKFELELGTNVVEAIKCGKKSLHENIKVNGIKLSEYSNKDLQLLNKKVQDSKNKLVKEIKENGLNESFDENKKLIRKKNQLLNILDEELTYRKLAYKYLNEEETLSDDELENMFGSQANDTDSEKSEKKTENKEENTKKDKDDVEEVELAKIVITLVDEEAANTLKQACLDADIPEDAIEIEKPESEEEETEETEDSENSEESEKTEEIEAKDESNESLSRYKNLNALFEDEDKDAKTSEDTEADNKDDDMDDDSDDTESDNKDEDADNTVKFILVNTDYAEKLADVLDKQYSISKEEFEEMIGGEIVHEDGEQENNEQDEATEEKEEEKDEKDENKEEDEIDPSELFKGL